MIHDWYMAHRFEFAVDAFILAGMVLVIGGWLLVGLFRRKQ